MIQKQQVKIDKDVTKPKKLLIDHFTNAIIQKVKKLNQSAIIELMLEKEKKKTIKVKYHSSYMY